MPLVPEALVCTSNGPPNVPLKLVRSSVPTVVPLAAAPNVRPPDRDGLAAAMASVPWSTIVVPV